MEQLRNNNQSMSHRLLLTLLIVSVFTNIILIIKLKYPNVINTIQYSLISAPQVLPTDQIRGTTDAKNTVIEYADFQCPFCADFHKAMNSLILAYNVRWIFRHFPLPNHPLASKAAEAAECAGDQGKFWEYSDALYGVTSGLTENTFSEIAVNLGLHRKSFLNCLGSGKYRAAVVAQYGMGLKMKIDGTPTVFINGKRYVGAISTAELDKLFGEKDR